MRVLCRHRQKYVLNPEARAAVFDMLERGETAPLLDPQDTADVDDPDLWNEGDEGVSGVSSYQDAQTSTRGYPMDSLERDRQHNYNSAMKGAVTTLAKLG